MRIPVLLLCPFSASSRCKLLFSPLSASIFNTSVLIFRFCRRRQACFPYFNRFFFVFSLLLITKSLPFLSIFLDFFSILFPFPFSLHVSILPHSRFYRFCRFYRFYRFYWIYAFSLKSSCPRPIKKGAAKLPFLRCILLHQHTFFNFHCRQVFHRIDSVKL